MTNYTMLPFGYLFNPAFPTILASFAGDGVGLVFLAGDTITVLPNAFTIETTATNGFFSAGIQLNGTASLDNSGTLTGEWGGVVAYFASAPSPAMTINNHAAGVINGRLNGMTISTFSGSGHVVNAGAISALASQTANNSETGNGILASSGTIIIDNSGMISGALGGAGISCSFLGSTFAGAGITINNSGTINGGIRQFSANDPSANLNVTNAGMITGDITNFSAAFSFDNSGGHLLGDVESFYSTGGLAAFTAVHGTVTGGILLSVGSTGLATLTGTGLHIGRDVTFGDGNDTIELDGGSTVGGSLNAGNGSDAVTLQDSSNVRRVIDLGSGDDTFTGGDAADRVYGRDGTDQVNLNGGNDVFYATGGTVSDGNDEADGGAGIDTYAASTGGTGGITIDLADSIATGASVGTDHIFNFENAIGGSNADFVFGNAANNVLDGKAGGDIISALGGNDRIFGGLGADTIYGGTGQDVMTGGNTITGGDGARDTFVFVGTNESGPAAGTRDWITDFTEGTAATADRINLATIDAVSTVAGNQLFAWIGTAVFSGVAGQLRYAVSGLNTIVTGDVNGDKAADFSVALSGVHTLAATDFVL